MYRFLVLVVLSASIVGVASVHAEAGVTAEVNAMVGDVVTVEVNGDTGVVVTPSAVDQATRVAVRPPTRVGLFFLGLRERLSIALTRDEVKKQEKQTEFAEARVNLAETILRESANPKRQAQAENMLARAEAFLARVQTNTEGSPETANAMRAERVKRMAESQLRVQKTLERIEVSVPEEYREAFEKRREQIEKHSVRAVEGFNRAELPEEVKLRIEASLLQLKATSDASAEFKAERAVLLEKAGSGDEEAKEALKDLHAERKATIQGLGEEYREAKASLRGAAEGGNRAAAQTLKVLERAENARQVEKKESKILPVRAMQRARDLDQKVEIRNNQMQVEIEGNAVIQQ
jgi:hypothetical protein